MPQGEVCPDEEKIGRNWMAKATRRPEIHLIERKSVHGSKMGTCSATIRAEFGGHLGNVWLKHNRSCRRDSNGESHINIPIVFSNDRCPGWLRLSTWWAAASSLSDGGPRRHRHGRLTGARLRAAGSPPRRFNAVTSISTFMRGSAKPQITVVFAGRTSLKCRPTTRPSP